jgi:hypothetical protein
MDQLPGPIIPPLPTVMVDDWPWRQIMGEHPPGTATAHQGADAIENLALGVFLGSPPRLGLGYEMVD